MDRATLGLATLSTLFALGAAEVGLRALAPLPDPFEREKHARAAFAPYVPSYFTPHESFAFRTEPALSGMSDEPTRFTVNNLGFRGDTLHLPKPPEEIRVFVVGGSTAEDLYLDDADATVQVVQERLAAAGLPHARVYAAAKSGDRSYDHVAMLVHRLVHLEPDVVVVFAGVNDLLADIHGVNYLLFPETGTAALLVEDAAAVREYRWSPQRSVAKLATELQVGRLAYAALRPRKYRYVVEEITPESRYEDLARLRRELPLAHDPPSVDPSNYARNLETMVGVARAHGFRLAFMTQATSWNSDLDDEVANWHWMNASADSSFTGAWMDAAMERYNDATREVARERDVPLLDMAVEMPKSLEFFYDDVHFNIRGAERAGTLLADFLLRHGLTEPATRPPAAGTLAEGAP